MCSPRWVRPDVATAPLGQFDDREQALGIVGVLDADPPGVVAAGRVQEHVASGIEVVVHAQRRQRCRGPGSGPALDDSGRIKRAVGSPAVVHVEGAAGEPAGDLGEVQHLGNRRIGVANRAGPRGGCG